MGYIRAKVHSRSILLNALIDSGNLYAELISEDLAKILKVKVAKTTRTVGTASKTGSVEILGRAAPIKLYLEGIAEPICFAPYVVRDLAHPVNLGSAFLRKYGADFYFREHHVKLSLKGSVTTLVPARSSLTRPSIDKRITEVLSKLKAQGGNPSLPATDILDLRVNALGPLQVPGLLYGERKRPLTWRTDTRYKVHADQPTRLKAGHMTVVPVRAKVPASRIGTRSTVFLEPKQNNKFLNQHELLVHPGCYRRVRDTLNVVISNLGTTDVVLPDKCQVAHISEADYVITPSVNVLDHREVEDLSEKDLVERRSFIIKSLELDDNSLLKKDEKSKDAIVQIFMKHFKAVAVGDADYGYSNLTQFHINVPKGTPPVRARVRPLNPFQEKDLERQMKAWRESNLIEPSLSPWASALVPVKKKGSDKLRWTVDYRALNKVTVKDSYPLHSIEGNLHKLSGSTVYSTLDSSNAFHSIAIPEQCRDYTSFVTPMGSWRFTRLPFGLANARSAYSRLVQMALDRLPPGFCLSYIDDVIIHSRTPEEHIGHLEQVVALHATCGMKLNLKKCAILREEVEYLGHLVSAKGIRMIPSYVEKILSWPLPKTGKELRSFLGFCGYYRAFIVEYAHLTAEMNKLKNQLQIEWPDEVKAKFESLKMAFKSEPVRGYPQYHSDSPFILDTDYSATNMAAILSQNQDGKEVFLGCCARKCNKAEASYPSHKGEMAAVQLGLRKFEHILRAKPFIIRTDSRCVQYLQTMKEYRGIWARWQVYLASFNFSLVHRAGKKQINADALSRRPGLVEEAVPDLDEHDDDFGDIEDVFALQEEVTLQQVAEATSADPVLAKILPFVKEGRKPDKEERKILSADGVDYVNVFECLSEQEGVVYYTLPEVNGVRGPARMCLPLSMQDAAFKAAHAHSLSGHYGMNQTYTRMKGSVYFPGMYSYISSRVNNCANCLAKRTSMGKPTHVQHREQLSYFGQRVYCDTVGPLTPHTFGGKVCRHFLTMEDGFSRYLVCVPVPTIDTDVLVEAIITHWVQKFGVPEVLHSDRGSAFTSKLFTEVMKRLGVVKTTTPAYNPQGNRVERSHKILGAILRADRRFEARSWPEKLAVACFAYNTAQNRVTGMSPYEVVFGRLPNLPLGLIFPFKGKEGTSFSTYVEHLKFRYARIFEQVCQSQNGVLLTELARDQARAAPEFAVGDTCYYFLGRVPRGLSKKLASRYLGPFTVVRVVSEALAVIYPKGTWSKNPREVVTSVRRLTKVDPDLGRTTLHPSRRHQVDLEVVLNDFSDEVVTYQDDFEDDDLPDVGAPPVPFWTQTSPMGPAQGPSDPQNPPDPPAEGGEAEKGEETAPPAEASPEGRPADEATPEDQEDFLTPDEDVEDTQPEAAADTASTRSLRPPVRYTAMEAISRMREQFAANQKPRKKK